MMSGQNQLICVSVRGQNASSESGLAPTDCVCGTDRPAVAATERGSHAGANHRHLASPTREEASEGGGSEHRNEEGGTFTFGPRQAGRRVIKFA